MADSNNMYGVNLKKYTKYAPENKSLARQR
jgi:hypothetical protein